MFSKDGVLIVRHENEIGATTDVAAHPEFHDRHTAKTIEGVQTAGWFTEDFTLTELKTLRCRERLPELRPQNTRFDGQDEILAFEELIELAQARGVGLYVEMKHPAYFDALGFSMTRATADILHHHKLDNEDAPVFIECFDARAMRAMPILTGARLGQLIAASDAFDLTDIAAYAHAVGPEKSLIANTTFIADAHAAGLQVHAWTFRPENTFLPPEFRSGENPAAHGDLEGELRNAIAMGIDGVFCDLPAVARRVIDS